jgi:hypothetical protein
LLHLVHEIPEWIIKSGNRKHARRKKSARTMSENNGQRNNFSWINKVGMKGVGLILQTH